MTRTQYAALGVGFLFAILLGAMLGSFSLVEKFENLGVLTSVMKVFSAISVLYLIAATIFVGSLVWVYFDARRLGHPPFATTLLAAFIAWPFSIVVWVFARHYLPKPREDV